MCDLLLTNALQQTGLSVIALYSMTLCRLILKSPSALLVLVNEPRGYKQHMEKATWSGSERSLYKLRAASC